MFYYIVEVNRTDLSADSWFFFHSTQQEQSGLVGLVCLGSPGQEPTLPVWRLTSALGTDLLRTFWGVLTLCNCFGRAKNEIDLRNSKTGCPPKQLTWTGT